MLQRARCVRAPAATRAQSTAAGGTWAFFGVLGALLAAGCYDMHIPIDPPYDAAVCPEIAGHARCGEGCGEGWCARPDEGMVCEGRLGICVSIEVEEAGGLDPRGFDTCCVAGCEPGAYCWSGGVCAGNREYPGEVGSWNGYCVPEQYCDEVGDHLDGITCVWSDGSVRGAGAPAVAECPASDPRAQLCGGPCGDCPFPDPVPYSFDVSSYSVSCIGRSDHRGLGVCAGNTLRLCTRDYGAERVCQNDVLGDPSIGIYGGAPCACLVLEDPRAPGSFYEWGWATLAESCRQYRELYPTSVRCYGDDWTDL